ncbi:MAG: amylo-alpha-1,6-glucosidase [Candidatus Saccharimonadaceae bacterium]
MHDSQAEYETSAQNEHGTVFEYPLLPGEAILSITEHPIRHHTRQPSTIKELLRLTRAKHIDDIGKSGPSIASLALQSESGIVNPDDEHLHLYEVVYGRDSLRVAIDLINSYPELARTTVLSLARLQGTTINKARDENRGQIVHEARDKNDPIAKRLTYERGWDWPYYGSVDATPEFIRTLAAYTKRSEENYGFLSETYTDKEGKERTILYSLEMALEWIATKQLENVEGLVEFKAALPNGIENQVWKDSWDAYHHADGTLANHDQGIASIEVQVTTYDALIDSAELFEDIFDNPLRANSLRAQAQTLRSAIIEHFWTEDKGGYFVLGTDRDDNGKLRQLKVRTSNMGHVLNSRLLKGEEPETVRMREAVVKQILSPEMLCFSGIRTLASDEVRFRPGAYHNGSVWLWETHHIAKGLRRLGYMEEADDLDRRMLKVIDITRMFPEYVRGEQNEVALNTRTLELMDSTYNRVNIVEQPPQEVQAWTVAAIRAIKNRFRLRAS